GRLAAVGLRCNSRASWQPEREDGALARRAARREITTHGASKIAADGEAETPACLVRTAGGCELYVRFEDDVQLVGRYSDAVIANEDPHTGVFDRPTDRDVTTA